jgi:hypothetical protein
MDSSNSTGRTNIQDTLALRSLRFITTAGAGLSRDERHLMSETQISLPFVDLERGQMSGTQLLDIMATTLRESWGLLLTLEAPQAYGLEPSDKEKHWKRQSELHLKFLSQFWDGDDGIHSCDTFGLLESARVLLTDELQFQAKFEAEARSFLVDRSTAYEIYESVVDLLVYLHNTQAAVVRRLGDVMAELEYLPNCHADQQADESLLTA